MSECVQDLWGGGASMASGVSEGSEGGGFVRFPEDLAVDYLGLFCQTSAVGISGLSGSGLGLLEADLLELGESGGQGGFELVGPVSHFLCRLGRLCSELGCLSGLCGVGGKSVSQMGKVVWGG